MRSTQDTAGTNGELDRRSFLQLIGVGTAGLAGLSDAQVQTYSTARAAYNAGSIVSRNGRRAGRLVLVIPVQAWTPTGGGGGGSWAWNAPDSATQKRIQQDLANRGRYSGSIDGVWGADSIKGIQTTCANGGYTGPIDRKPGLNTCHYVRVYAQRFGSYTGPVDRILGPNSWNGFALGLERP